MGPEELELCPYCGLELDHDIDECREYDEACYQAAMEDSMETHIDLINKLVKEAKRNERRNHTTH